MMNNIILNSSYIGLFILAKGFSENVNKILLLSPKKHIYSLLLKKKRLFCFLGTGVLFFSCPVQNFFGKNSMFNFSFKDQFLKNNRKIRILRECCLPWCHVCFSMKIILFVYFFQKVVGMPPVNIHT